MVSLAYQYHRLQRFTIAKNCWVTEETNGFFEQHSPFPVRTKVDKVSKIINCYVHPHRNLYWLEALHQLMDKDVVKPVQNLRASSTFLGSKTHNHWRPSLDLSKPNLSETIRTTLQQGEWVTSIDFKDTYFHIPIQEQSRKYLRFHVQGQTYQFKALPLGLSTAPMEFTVVAEELKLMAIHKGIRIHQYLVGEIQIPSGLSPEYSRSSENMPRTRLASELGEIGTGIQTSLCS